MTSQSDITDEQAIMYLEGLPPREYALLVGISVMQHDMSVLHQHSIQGTKDAEEQMGKSIVDLIHRKRKFTDKELYALKGGIIHHHSCMMWLYRG